MPLSHLSRPQREHLRKLMQARVSVLRREINAELHDHEHLPAEIARDAQELNDLMAALARLDRPDFGRCIDCDEPISWPRLNALPQAQRCLPCEALEERLHPPPGSHAPFVVRSE